MILTLIIPAYNEVKTLPSLLERVCQLPIPLQLLIVDDGSTDSTREFLQGSAQKHASDKISISTFFHPKNSGKGSAIRTALPHITGDIVVVQDADLEYHPDEIPRLIAPILEDRADIVFGSRFLNPVPANIYLRYLWGNKVVTWTLNILCGVRFTDSYTGYKFYKSEIFKSLNLESSGFEIDAEINVKISRRRYRVTELPISYTPRTIEEGKKIGWKDAFLTLWTTFRYRFLKPE